MGRRGEGEEGRGKEGEPLVDRFGAEFCLDSHTAHHGLVDGAAEFGADLLGGGHRLAIAQHCGNGNLSSEQGIQRCG